MPSAFFFNSTISLQWAGVVHSLATSLVHVASVFILAGASGAADEICSTPNEIETAFLAL